MSKKLVAYFSASGITHEVAEKLAKVLDADLVRICPQEEYTEADLDWRDLESRSSREMSHPLSRPKMKELDIKVEDYDTVFLGFPIWWYTAPRIIETFLESYDFSGKAIIPFATSGGSKMGRTVARLVQAAPGAVILPGKILEKEADLDALQEWAKKQSSYIKLHKALTNAYHTMTERKYDTVQQIANYLETKDETYLSNLNDVRTQMTQFDIDVLICYILETFCENWQEVAEISGNAEELKLAKEAIDRMTEAGCHGLLQFDGFLYAKDPTYILRRDELRIKVCKYSTAEYYMALVRDFCVKNFEIPIDLKK